MKIKIGLLTPVIFAANLYLPNAKISAAIIKRMRQTIGKMLSLILIVGATGSVNFGQDSKASDRKLRGDVGRLTREVKRSERGVYLARFETNAKKTGLYFVPKKTLWAKLTEAEKIAVAEDWWRRWRTIRGAADDSISFMKSGEEIFCNLERCYVPECAL